MSINPIASDELKKKRMALCEVCPHLRKNIPNHEDAHLKIGGNKCNLCGCYMPAKTGIKFAKCPAKKW